MFGNENVPGLNKILKGFICFYMCFKVYVLFQKYTLLPLAIGTYFWPLCIIFFTIGADLSIVSNKIYNLID